MSVKDELITIVSGLPRSGTSMMMSMIAAGGIPPLVDGKRTADKDNPKGYYEFEPVKHTAKDASWVDQAGGKVVKVIHTLLLSLPLDRRYRVVFMLRDLSEVVRSQDEMLRRSGKPSSPHANEQIKAFYAAQLDQVKQFLKDKDCFEVLYVPYGEIIESSGRWVDAVNLFLGESLDVDAMRAVVDPTLYRQRAQTP
ncbi:MAG: sulfotransferase domain-containing protein [Phycisphaerae bacterium]